MTEQVVLAHNNIETVIGERAGAGGLTQAEADALYEPLGGGGGGGGSDHGALTGLADDDHPQYHNDARGDVRYDATGTAAAEVATHDGDAGAHAGTFDPAGTAASERAAHEAAPDPHPQYTTEAEVNLIALGFGTDLGNVPDPDSVLITSSTGNDTDVPSATAALAGFMSAADKIVLDALAAGGTVAAHEAAPDPHPQYTTDAEATALAQAEVAAHEAGSVTNHADFGGIAPLDGQVPTWVTANSQYEPQTPAAGGGTNLANTPDADSVTVTSDTGTDTDILAATAALAGVMTAADKTSLDTIAADYTTTAEATTIADTAVTNHENDPGDPHSQYAFRPTTVAVTSADTPFAVSLDDHVLLVDAALGAVTVVLLSAALDPNRLLRIKKTDASANAVTIQVAGTDEIDSGGAGQPIDLVVQNEAVTLISDTANWWIL